MPNPGSPQAQAENRQKMPTFPMSKKTMIGMVAALAVVLVIYYYMEPVGRVLNYGLGPLLGFGGRWPVLTLISAGLIMITISTVVRSFMTDSVKQAKSQRIQSDFNKEMKQARAENNLFKLKKLQEEQPKMMAASMESSTAMMKIMPITMIIIIPIFTWIRYYLTYTAIGEVIDDVKRVYIALPWDTHFDLLGMISIIPWWIVIYMMISLPIGQLENRAVRYYLLKKRLKELDGTA